MIKATAVKTSLCVTALMLSLSTGVKVKAETYNSDKGIAGIAATLDIYYEANLKEESNAVDELMETLSQQKAVTLSAKVITEVVSPYANLGISTATDYVNIRSKANTESEVVGKLYHGCATDIIETEGEWVKIRSGNVDGYIKAEYLAIGEDAEVLINEFSDKYATVINTQTLRVRDKKSIDATTITLIPEGETYFIVKEFDEWAEIQIDGGDGGDGEEGGVTGFVSKEYIDIEVEFQYAISIEEEQAKLEAEEAARQAESERLEKLAIQQEEHKAAVEKEEAKENATKSETKTETKSETKKTEAPVTKSETSTTSTNSGSSSGQEIADYAMKFLGNPYEWSGTSLTNGTDCSGFVMSIYAQFGYGISRTSRDQSSNAGSEVSFSNLQAGDLIFYRNSGGTVNHVALYIGNGKVIHASNERDGIKISSYNYRTPYKARRII